MEKFILLILALLIAGCSFVRESKEFTGMVRAVGADWVDPHKFEDAFYESPDTYRNPNSQTRIPRHIP